jgi:branched-subunit amino acid aminotransferase/4-amino-4-deoxychorismate lyase
MKALGFRKHDLQFSLKKAMQNLVKKNNVDDCAIRITVLNEEQPFVIMHARNLPTTQKDFVNLITVPDTRDVFKTIKTINRLVNEQATEQAKNQGADDALFVQGKNIIESTICNVFSLDAKGKLITPPLDEKGLRGITREIIMEKTKVAEKNISQETKGPLVLVNSLRIQKVRILDGRKLQDGEELLKKITSLIEQATNEQNQSYHL